MRAVILAATMCLIAGGASADNCASIRAFNEVHPHNEQKREPCHCTPKSERPEKVRIDVLGGPIVGDPPGWKCDGNYYMYDKQCRLGVPCRRDTPESH